MKKRLPKHMLLRSLSPWWFYISMVYFFAFISCNHPPRRQINNEPVKKTQPIISIKKDRFASPKVTYITAANQPKVVRAGKPIIKIDSTNGGLSFFRNFGIEQGLPNNHINKSLMDNAGNLWFGTYQGACKYDGKAFTNYDISNGMLENRVWSVLQDKDGNLWFGTLGGGVSKYDGKKFINYTKTQGLLNDWVQCMMQDDSGNIWLGTSEGASKFDGKTFTNYTKKQGLAGDFVQCIIQDKKRDFWFATRTGVSKYEGTRFINYNAFIGLKADDEVQSILEDKKGDLWFGTFGYGAIKYDGTAFTNYSRSQGLADNKVRQIIQDKNGLLWFATAAGGVSKYDGKNFTNYTTSQGLADNSIRSILEDRDGDIWFGTIGGGLSKYINNGLTYYPSSQWLGDFLTGEIVKDRAGNIWFCHRFGATKYDGKSFTTFRTNLRLIGTDDVGGIMQDNKGNYWFGTDSGLNKYDTKDLTNYSTTQGVVNDGVFDMIQDNKGNIWIGTESNGTFKYDGNKVTNYDTAQGLPNHFITSIIQDRSGNLWFGTFGGGASKFDGKSFTNYTTIEGLASDSIICIIQDRFGNIWFGTYREGLSRYDGKSFTNYTTASGLANNTISAIVEDSARNIIWIGTELGLSGLKHKSTLKSNLNKRDIDVFENFNTNTGYPIYVVNIKSLCLDKTGVLWIGSNDNKIMKFDYNLIHKNVLPLTLLIQNIRVNNENICWNNFLANTQTNKTNDTLALLNEMASTFGKVLSTNILDSLRNKFEGIKFDSIARFNPVPINLVLPYKDNSISIDFVAIEPSKPKQVKYQYKLEGYDKDWSPPSNNTTAVFGNIPEGGYTFKLKALSPYGIWSETEYKFKVLPPWYRTWWAYALYALLFIAPIWSFIYYRSKQLRRENRILEEKVSHRTEQLKQSLENLKSTQAQLIQSEKMASLGELTAGIAHEIQNPLNFVNNFSEVNNELITEMREEIAKKNFDEVDQIAKDVQENEQKINHHGKRADAIVKGMLQHSRTSTGVKEPTDINALADEYLRLSYHGLRAKDKDFNATIKTDFDSSIEKINIIPQDIGRVLLNLYNNAFYAVNV